MENFEKLANELNDLLKNNQIKCHVGITKNNSSFSLIVYYEKKKDESKIPSTFLGYSIMKKYCGKIIPAS